MKCKGFFMLFLIVIVTTSCTTRVVVNMYPLDPKVLNLPICYLEKCDGLSEEECAVKAYEAFISAESSAWTLISDIPQNVLVAGQRSYYVQAKPLTNMDNIADRWAELSCTPSSSPTVTPARHLTCATGMGAWVKTSNSKNGSILQLSTDSAYRSACLRISD